MHSTNPPGGHFSLANFSQKFDQKLTSNPEGISHSIFCEKVYRQPHPEGSFYSIFCEKIVLLDQDHIDLIAAIKPFQFFFDDDKAVRLRD